MSWFTSRVKDLLKAGSSYRGLSNQKKGKLSEAKQAYEQVQTGMMNRYTLHKKKDSLIEAKEVRTESSVASASYPPKNQWYYSFVIGNFHISFT